MWRWIWLVAIGAFAVGEALLPGTFFLLPFAAGAIVAAVTAFRGWQRGFAVVVVCRGVGRWCRCAHSVAQAA